MVDEPLAGPLGPLGCECFRPFLELEPFGFWSSKSFLSRTGKSWGTFVFGVSGQGMLAVGTSNGRVKMLEPWSGETRFDVEGHQVCFSWVFREASQPGLIQ